MKLMDFEKRLFELQRALELNVSISPGTRSNSCDIHTLTPRGDPLSPQNCCMHVVPPHHLYPRINPVLPIDSSSSGKSRGEAVLIAAVEDLRRQNERLMQLILKQNSNASSSSKSRLPVCNHGGQPAPLVSGSSSSGHANAIHSHTTTSTSLLDTTTPSWSSKNAVHHGVPPLQGIHTVYPIYHSPNNGKGSKEKQCQNAQLQNFYNCNGSAGAHPSHATGVYSWGSSNGARHTRTGRLPPQPRRSSINGDGGTSSSTNKGLERDAKGVMRNSTKNATSEADCGLNTSSAPVDLMGGMVSNSLSSKRRSSYGRSSVKAGEDNSSNTAGGIFESLAAQARGKHKKRGSIASMPSPVGTHHHKRHHHRSHHRRHATKQRPSSSSSDTSNDSGRSSREDDSSSQSSVPSSPLSSRSKRLLAEHLKRRKSPPE